MKQIRTAVALLLTAAALALTGCAAENGTAGTPASPEPSASADDDAAGWVEGKVSRGGSGPCYGLVDLNGVEYAVYSAGGATLAPGDRVRAQVKPARLRIHCGAGKAVQADSIQPLG